MGKEADNNNCKVRGIVGDFPFIIPVKFCKFRKIGLWVLGLYLCFAYSNNVYGQSHSSLTNSENLQDSVKHDTFGLDLPTFRTLSFSFSTHEQALDSLLLSLLKKKGMPVQAYMPKAVFTKQWKLHDTAASQQIIDGAWMGYQYQFSKSFQKTRKYLLKNKIVLKRSEIGNKPLKITEDIEGSGIKKYEYVVMYKKLKYVLSYQLWWIDDKAYWVNEITFRLKPIQ